MTGFLGPNGAGKTTTMRMILGLDHPTSGTATIDGKAYRQLRRSAAHGRRTAGRQAGAPEPSVRNHLRWIAASNRIPARRVDEVLEMVGLTAVAGARAGTLSLGMSQRLGIAAALIGDPPVLLFDEPVNGLDPEGIHWVRTLMRTLAAEGRTVLVSSHLLSEMANTADRLVVIGKGRLIASTSVGRVHRPLRWGDGAGAQPAAAAPARRAHRGRIDRAARPRRADRARRHDRGRRGAAAAPLDRAARAERPSRCRWSRRIWRRPTTPPSTGAGADDPDDGGRA